MSRASGRFALAVHALALLASADDTLSSEQIAGSLGTTAAHTRQILAELVEAGVVAAHRGRGGGYSLARSPKSIALSEVYRALNDVPLLTPSASEPHPECFVGGGMRKTFEEIADRAHDAVLAALGKETLADVAHRAQQVSRLPVPTGFHRI